MNGMLVVIPVVDYDLFTQCYESIERRDSSSGINLADILIIDNSKEGIKRIFPQSRIYRDPEGHNIGVARAWNVGAREVLAKGLDYLVIMSSSMLFGPELHTTWKKQMETFWGVDVIEAEGHSWHLIAFHRSVFEKVGLFDENFYPGYFEAIDFGYRMRMLGLEGGWTRAWVNAISQGSGLSLQHVKFLAKPLLDYYREKWGGDKGEEKWTLPYGDRLISYYRKYSIPELVDKYQLEGQW